MKTIGFGGGCTTIELGPKNDVLAFFNCVDEFIAKRESQEYSLITDVLFRRYIPLDELDSASRLMGKIKQKLATVSSDKVNWEGRLDDSSRLDIKLATLAEVFSAFFVKFEEVVESAKDFYQDWGIYQAVKIVIADIPDCMTYKSLPLEAYDTVTDDPLWLRDARGEAPLGIKDGAAYIK